MGNKASCSRKVDNNINAVLPAEMLERVFQCLSIKELKKVVRVCRRWREVGGAPELWKEGCVKINGYNLSRISDTLKSGRFRMVKKLIVFGFYTQGLMGFVSDVHGEIFEAMIKHQGLKILDLRENELTHMNSVELDLLIEVATQLEELDLAATFLIPSQITKLCLAQKDGSTLKRLTLNGNDLSSVELGVISQITKQLQVMNLEYTELTPMQATTIFNAIAEGSQMKELNLRGECAMAQVDPNLLANGVNKLENVNLSSAYLTSHQINALFTAIGNGTRLKKLTLVRNNLASIKPKLLVKVVTKLEGVNLKGTSLSFHQITALCIAIREGTPLKTLDISGNGAINSVEPILVARAIIQLEDVSLTVRHNSSESLPNQHVQELFKAIGGTSQLRRLNIQENNLSSVDPDVMATAVNKLEAANMIGCDITKQQAISILTRSLEATSLKQLKLKMSYEKPKLNWWNWRLVTLARQVIPQLEI